MKIALKTILPEIIELRHTLHANPELKFQEYATAKLITQTLQSYGYAVTTGIGGTGVTALLDSGKPGKTVALRAEMDALPIHEQTDLPYQSKIAGKMHACGHDGHTATLLAVANILKNQTDHFCGKIKFIFQPAEESGGGGAIAMIEAGVIDDVDAIFAYHNRSGTAIGKLNLRPACLMTSSDGFRIHIQGKGGHSSRPERCINPIQIGAALIQNINTLISQTISAFDKVTINITEFHSGTANNIIPDQATLTGSIRMASPSIRKSVKERLKNLVETTANQWQAQASVTFNSELPNLINSWTETELVTKIACQLLGKENVETLTEPVMASDDFAWYLQKIPGCYFFVGNGKSAPRPHENTYQFHDEVIPIAAELLIETALGYLKHN